MQKIVVEEGVAMFVLFSLMTGFLSMFIQECFQSGMILRRYYLLLNLLWIRSRKHPRIRHLLKPLGLCVYCQNFWLSLIIYFGTFDINPFHMILFVGGSYMGIELLTHIKK